MKKTDKRSKYRISEIMCDGDIYYTVDRNCYLFWYTLGSNIFVQNVYESKAKAIEVIESIVNKNFNI